MTGELLDTCKQIDQWVCWRYETRDGEETKPPIAPFGGTTYASTSDSDTWGSYEEAVSYHERDDTDTAGVGFVLTEEDTIAGADLDGCRDPETGRIEPWAREVVDMLDSYAEVSPSGTGLRAFVQAFMPDGKNKAEQPRTLSELEDLEKNTELEMYDDGRYLTFTGDHLDGRPVDAEPRKSSFVDVHEEYIAEDEEGNEEAETPDETPDLDLSDEEILKKARNAENGGKFEKLENGSDSLHGDDTSNADKAFCQMLAFWTGGDRQQMDRLFRNSSRYRQKWDDVHRGDGATYGEMTIDAALADQSEFFDPEKGTETQPDPSTLDYSEIERGEAILETETEPEDPAGELKCRNGCYGYEREVRNDEGELVDVKFDEITNFTLELEEILDTYEGEILSITVRPNHPRGEEYNVKVHPTVFNEARTFREEIVRGRTTWYNAGRKSRQALNDLRQTVGSQSAPRKQGTEFIGLHGDEYDEWVTPSGTLTADGWKDDAAHVYYPKSSDSDDDLESSSVAEKYALDAEDGVEYDSDEVASLLEELGWTRQPARGLPVLGWFYSTPVKPIIQELEGSFNLLQVAGGTGTGKTSTLEMYYQLFGAAPSPFSSDDTRFTIEKRLSGSCGFPIWLDEYKPTDLRESHRKWLHQKFREVFRGASTSKGRPSLGEVMLHFRAPVVFSGEQTVSKPAVRRRTVITQFSSGATSGEYERAYSRVTGASYETDDGEQRHPDGYNLHDHARAYFTWVLNQSREEIAQKWRDAGDELRELMKKMNVSGLDKSEQKGLQTIVFGVQLFRDFADHVGADLSELPGESELQDAIVHVAENVGPSGRRREHIDDFTELLAQAAQTDYIVKGEHYKIVNSRKFDTENALAFHMPSCFSAVKKYMRDYNIEAEYSFLGKTDYVDNYADKASEGSSYPLATSHRVKDLGRGSKAVLIDLDEAADALGADFEPAAFGVSADEDAEEAEGDDSDGDGGAQPDYPDPVPLGDIDHSRQDVASAIGEVEFGQYDGRDSRDKGPAWTATLKDETGEAELVVFDEEYIPEMYDSTGRFEPDALHVKGAETGDYEGTLQLVIRERTVVERAQVGAGETGSTSPGEDQNQLGTSEQPEAEADGGQPAGDAGSTSTVPEDAEGPLADARRLREVLEQRGVPMEEMDLIVEATQNRGLMEPDQAEAALEKARKQGFVTEGPEGLEPT